MGAIIKAGSDGDFHRADTWAGGKVPGPEDVADANGRVVIVRKDVKCAALTNKEAGGTFYCAKRVKIDAKLEQQTMAIVMSSVLIDKSWSPRDWIDPLLDGKGVKQMMKRNGVSGITPPL